MARRAGRSGVVVVGWAAWLIMGLAWNAGAWGAPAIDPYTAQIPNLPQLQLQTFAGQFSSRDRTGGNNDWSNEQGNRPGYLYRDQNGDRVLAQLRGSGALTRLWFTGIDRVGNLRIYIDDDTRPTYDLPVRELFAGTHAPFVRPWVYDDSLSSGGFVSYVRLPFHRSLKVTTTGEPSYYHIGYETGPAVDAPAAALNWAETSYNQRQTGEQVIAPGQTADLPAPAGPAILTQLEFTLPDVALALPAAARRARDNGRAFTGFSEFTVRIDPNNNGVKLIRRLDYGIADQTAQVYVDGERIGYWSTPGVAVGFNWKDAPFDIPAGYTRGKESLRIRVQFVSSQIDWNEFYYWVYVRPTTPSAPGASNAAATTPTLAGDNSAANPQANLPGEPTLIDEQGVVWALTDSLDVGDIPSEQAHDYQIVRENWRGDRDFEYAPPTSPADEAKLAASQRLLDQLWLQASWDGESHLSVQAPLSLLFAAPLGPFPVHSTLVQVAATPAGARLTSWWPMPYARQARLQLRNTGTEPVRVQFALESHSVATVAQLLAQAQIGYFRATYNQEHPTSPGQDYTLLQVGGVGKLVGVSLRLAGPPNRSYLEGDERIRVDGRCTPAIYGTGTEDHFGGGWYFNRGPFSQPVYGAPGHTARGSQDSTSVYRWFLPDPVPFRNGIVYSLEHGGRDDVSTDYESVTFWYGIATDGVRQTDEFQPADLADQLRHNWQLSGQAVRQTVSSAYEGPLDRVIESHEGLYHSGISQFTLTIEPDNQGVLLRRLLDQAVGEQVATVRVDGQVVGTWANYGENLSLRWADSDFAIPAAFTQGRSTITVQIEPISRAWTTFGYQAYSLLTPKSAAWATPAPDASPTSTTHAAPVTQVNVRVVDDLNQLEWPASTGAAFYRIYRGPQPTLAPDPWYQVNETPATQWTDPASANGEDTYYRVVAVDRFGVPAAPSPVTYAASTGLVRVEGERLGQVKTEGSPFELQGMDWVSPDWSGGQQLFFRARQAGAWVEGIFSVPQAGVYDLAVYYTLAPDYGQVQLLVDGRPVGAPWDGYASRVRHSSRLSLGAIELASGPHTLRMEVVGKAASATGYFAGLDCIELRRTK